MHRRTQRGSRLTTATRAGRRNPAEELCWSERNRGSLSGTFVRENQRHRICFPPEKARAAPLLNRIESGSAWQLGSSDHFNCSLRNQRPETQGSLFNVFSGSSAAKSWDFCASLPTFPIT